MTTSRHVLFLCALCVLWSLAVPMTTAEDTINTVDEIHKREEEGAKLCEDILTLEKSVLENVKGLKSSLDKAINNINEVDKPTARLAEQEEEKMKQAVDAITDADDKAEKTEEEAERVKNATEEGIQSLKTYVQEANATWNTVLEALKLQLSLAKEVREKVKEAAKAFSSPDEEDESKDEVDNELTVETIKVALNKTSIALNKSLNKANDMSGLTQTIQEKIKEIKDIYNRVIKLTEQSHDNSTNTKEDGGAIKGQEEGKTNNTTQSKEQKVEVALNAVKLPDVEDESENVSTVETIKAPLADTKTPLNGSLLNAKEMSTAAQTVGEQTGDTGDMHKSVAEATVEVAEQSHDKTTNTVEDWGKIKKEHEGKANDPTELMEQEERKDQLTTGNDMATNNNEVGEFSETTSLYHDSSAPLTASHFIAPLVPLFLLCMAAAMLSA